MPYTATQYMSTERDQLFGFRDSISGARLGFYRPADRYDLWEGYVAGVTRTYRHFGAEMALTLLPTTPDSSTPIFAVAMDDDDSIVAGWYVNGPLNSVTQAFAPEEFAADPVSAALIADWISTAIPHGVIELKGGWVDIEAQNKSALAGVVGRSVIHALRALNVNYAFATAAEHATRRWRHTGGRPLPGIAPTPYPDERYLTSFFSWDVDSAYRQSTVEQRRLFAADLESAMQHSVATKAAA